jgi:hypothetical protein
VQVLSARLAGQGEVAGSFVNVVQIVIIRTINLVWEHRQYPGNSGKMSMCLGRDA